MLLNRLLFIFLSFVVFSCSTDNNGRIITSNNFKLQFHELSNNSKGIFNDCILNASLLATNEKGKVVFSSQNFSLQGVSSFYYDSLLVDSPLDEVFK